MQITSSIYLHINAFVFSPYSHISKPAFGKTYLYVWSNIHENIHFVKGWSCIFKLDLTICLEENIVNELTNHWYVIPNAFCPLVSIRVSINYSISNFEEHIANSYYSSSSELLTWTRHYCEKYIVEELFIHLMETFSHDIIHSSKHASIQYIDALQIFMKNIRSYQTC